MAFCYIGKYFCVLDAVFTDLGKAWLQMPWMHVKLGFICIVFVPRKMPTNFQSIAK
jgi:hypothetical protein